MMEILRRAGEEDLEGGSSEEGEEGDCGSLEKRLAGVDLGQWYLIE